jgi:hypothetical protein
VCAFYDPGVLIFFSGDGRWESTATMLVALKNGQAQNLYPVLFLWSLAGLCPLQCLLEALVACSTAALLHAYHVFDGLRKRTQPHVHVSAPALLIIQCVAVVVPCCSPCRPPCREQALAGA